MSDFELAKKNFLDGCEKLALEDYSQAEYHFHESLSIIPNRASTLINLSVVQLKLRKYSEAKISAEKVIAIDGANSQAHLNLGLIERELSNYVNAIDCFDKAIVLRPDYAEAYSNKGNVLQDLKRYAEAIASYNKAISLNPNYAEAHSNKGNALRELHEYEEAIFHYDIALSLKPKIHWALGDIFSAKMKICSWSDLGSGLEIIANKVLQGDKVASPFLALLLSDNLEVQKKSSEIYAKEKFILSGDLGPILKRPAGPKLRLGYFSSDLYYHPVSIWLTEQLENHDKSRFELFAFSFTQVKDPMRARLENIFDHFIEIDGKSDLEVAQIARTLGIDIAFDLCVYTGEARPGIFAIRAAPIQVSHLGFPGTSGSNCIDYFISDMHLLPEYTKHFYTEKIAHVPCAYTYDNERQLSTEILTRAQFGLPQNSFVFTCQNGNQKIMPEVFGIWMDILKAVPGSVLWLMQPNPTATQNLIKNALSHGVESDRLIFTKREVVAVDQEKARISRYLSSYRLADLFLDTWPYNAGTTAVDALFAGLPVLTKAGLSPVARMATSALNAIEMPELITKTASDYRALAIELATDPQKLNLIKDKLASNKLTSPLFDSFANTKYLESAYMRMYELYQADLQPDHIVIT